MMKKRAMNSCKQSNRTKASSRIKRWALIHGSFEALHCWPDAPESEAYLRVHHRHLFEVRIQIEVFHADREIEYYNFKRRLGDVLERMSKPIEFSCENYCDYLCIAIKARYPKRDLKIRVLEDGKEGAECEYSK